MKELIVKPSFSSKITVNNEYLEKQLIDLSIKGGYHYELFEYALNQYRLRPWLYDIYGENLLLLKVLRWVLKSRRIKLKVMSKDIKALDKFTKVIPVLAAIYFIIRSIL